MRRIVACLALASALMAGAAQAAPKCAPAGAAKDVEAAVRAWFDAGRTDNLAALGALQTPGFYAYDGGKRFDGLALGDLLKTIHASGRKIEWNLGVIDVHLACDQAWTAWVNKGAGGMPGAMEPVVWLESAVLGYRGGRWRLEFLHSDRVRN